MSNRFTLDGSEALEARLDGLCGDVLRGVRSVIPPGKLDGLLLGGGYGRGEGGVLRMDGCDAPYNDLEFYVFVRGNHHLNRRRYAKPLWELGQRCSREAGIEIDLAIDSLARLRRNQISMFSYDLVSAHRWILGNDDLLRGCEHHRLSETIPLAEATRLLWNRCSGLLFAQEHLQRGQFSPASADFVGRNLAKAKLALGDVVLTAFRQYHWSARKRHQRLEKLTIEEELPWLPELQRLHVDGLEFKLHPERAVDSQSSLAREHSRLTEFARHVWLWLESRRLQFQFSSPEEYALDGGDKCPESSRWRNRILNGASFGWISAASASGARYPRERLLRSLPLLLWTPDVLEAPRLVAFLQHQLRTEATTFAEFVAAYERLWRRFN